MEQTNVESMFQSLSRLLNFLGLRLESNQPIQFKFIYTDIPMTKIAKRMCNAFNIVYLLLAIKWIDSVRPQLLRLRFSETCI